MKLVKYLISIILSLVVFYDVNSNNTVYATKVKTYGEWNETPLKHYKNLDVGFNTGADDIDIFVKTPKKRNINFNLSAGTNTYQLKPLHLSKISFKKDARSKVNLRIIETSNKGEQSFTLKNVGVYRRVNSSKKKYNYLLRLSIPIKKLNADLDKSTIMNLQVKPKNDQQHKVTTVGLSTGPIMGIVVSLISFIFLGSFMIRNKKIRNN